MTIGQRILQARTEAGLSQRELAGENITRNMLSAIEHDKAKPSLDTLIYLSGVLKRPVGYFLGEEIPAAEGLDAMVQARKAYDLRRYRACLNHLKSVPEGPVWSREKGLLTVLATLSLGEQAVSEGRLPYARKLLAAQLGTDCPYYTPELERRLAIARQKAGIPSEIPEDSALMVRAEQALKEKRFEDAERYLQAQDSRGDRWHFLMGEALFGQGDYEKAVTFYHGAEGTMGKQIRKKLQLCYAELKNFEKAYYYATLTDDK